MHTRKHRMQNTHRWMALAAAATLASALVPAIAQAQSTTVKAGLIQYNTNSKTDGVTGVGIPAGADAKTGNATTFLLTFEYEFAPSIGVELVLGVPPKITAKGTGSVAFLGDVLSARNVAPTLLFNYHFDLGSFKPYLGIGVNYTKFIDVKSPYFADVKLSDSKGLAGQVGFDYAFSKDWGLFASVGKAQVKSKVVAQGATVLQSTIDFRPITFAFGAGYRF
jgi:outer membrane protein